MNSEIKRLYRSRNNRIIAGVCGGLAEYFSIDPVIIRLLFVFLSFGMGTGVLVYIIMTAIVPLEHSSHGTGREKGSEYDQEHQTEHSSETDTKMKESSHDTIKTFFGFTCILLGLFGLMFLFVPFPHMVMRLFWPVILIIGGLFLIGKKSLV